MVGKSYQRLQCELNLLNELGEKIRCEPVLSILFVFTNEFNKFNNTGGSIYHLTLKSHFLRKFCSKMSQFRH